MRIIIKIFDSNGIQIGEKSPINSIPLSVLSLSLQFNSEERSLPDFDVEIDEENFYIIIRIVFSSLEGYMGSRYDFQLKIVPESSSSLVIDNETGMSNDPNLIEPTESGGIKSILFKRRVSKEFGN